MHSDFILLFISVISMILGYHFYIKSQHLMKTGKKAQAIIYKNNYKSDSSGGCYYPVVRFLTERNVWVTQELNIGYSSKKTEGSKVEVLYDPLDPTVVEINGRFHLMILPWIFMGIGMLLPLIELVIILWELF